MALAALVTWLIATLGGSYLLSIWLRNGGMRQQRGGATRFPAGLIFGHFLLAAVGLVLWLFYVLTDNEGTGWTALVLVLLTAVLGFTMLTRWLPGRGSAPTEGTGGELPAERHFDTTAVLGHGTIAVITVVLVVVAVLAS